VPRKSRREIVILPPEECLVKRASEYHAGALGTDRHGWRGNRLHERQKDEPKDMRFYEDFSVNGSLVYPRVPWLKAIVPSSRLQEATDRACPLL
jgi:hypothetical protein